MWLILAGIALIGEGVWKLLEEEDDYKGKGWINHQLDKLAKGEPPAELERRMREVARDEIRNRAAE